MLGLAPKRKVVVYARVSSADQKDDLERQKNRLIEFARSQGYEDVIVLEDVASGLNEKRRGLGKLFDLVANGEVEVVFITYKDRLTRFGFSYIERFFSSHGVSIHVVNGEANKELVEDLIAIVTSFAGRLYGMRSHKKRKVVETLGQALRDD